MLGFCEAVMKIGHDHTRQVLENREQNIMQRHEKISGSC